MEKLINLKIGLLTVGLITLFVAGGFLLGSGSNNEYSIVLGEDGFSPKNLTIKKGDRVKFTTTLNRTYWPASDLHPTHELYSEFDPKQPIPPDEEWTFRFNQKGKWSFHDHMGPSNRGTIAVE